MDGFIVENEVGDGEQSLYVYYYENDKKLAQATGKASWECKIGYTTSSIDKRIYEQDVETARHTYPTIGLVVKTRFAHLLEIHIHRELKKRGKKIENSPGFEWFSTSPEEVFGIYESIKDSLEGTFLSSEMEYIDSGQQLGYVLRNIRTNQNLTQINVQEMTGITQAMVARAELGVTDMRFSTWMKMIKCYGYSLLLIKES